MQTIYTVGARGIIHPRYVTNVTNQDIDVSYSSENYTIRAGETILTDLNIANIFENYGVVREHHPETARVLSEVRTLVVSLADPTTLSPSERRRPAVQVVHTVPSVSDELQKMNIGQLHARARSLGLSLDPKSKKLAMIEAISREESERAAEEGEAE